MAPGGGFFGPEAGGEFLAELGFDLGEEAGVVGGAVFGDGAPVGGFGGEAGAVGRDFGVPAFGLGKLLADKIEAAEAGAEPGVEVGARQVAFVADTLVAIVIEQQDGRGPDGAEALEPGGVDLDVGGDGQEMLLDEGRGSGVGITLGFQPSASPSGGGGAEVEQQRALFGLGAGESVVHFGNPIHTYRIYLSAGRR